MSRTNTSSRRVGAFLIGITFVALLYLETRRPLRATKNEPKFRRVIRNLVVAGGAAAAVQLAEKPLTMPLIRLVERRRLGLLKILHLHPRLETLLGVLGLDYTLYLWHVLTHKVPFLWRFHKAHHADLDMDASTGLRFHFGEMTLSAAFRATQVLVLGLSQRALSLWNTLLLCEVMFHHSNLRLSPRTERWLSKFIVTPRLHGIHHSIVREETDSNWSSGLTIWDWLHGTLRRDVLQDRITLGVAAFRQPKDVTFSKVVAMPLSPDPGFHLPDGTSTEHRGFDGDFDSSDGKRRLGR